MLSPTHHADGTLILEGDEVERITDGISSPGYRTKVFWRNLNAFRRGLWCVQQQTGYLDTYVPSCWKLISRKPKQRKLSGFGEFIKRIDRAK